MEVWQLIVSVVIRRLGLSDVSGFLVERIL